MLYEDPHTHLRPDPFEMSESAVSLEWGLEEQRDLGHRGRDWLPTSTFVVPRACLGEHIPLQTIHLR
jgi:hypothetical protein